MERRVNRCTTAQFQFESGAIGSLFHSAVLEGSQFTSELDIYGDGIHIVIGNPYYKPFLKMRSSRRDDYEEVTPHSCHKCWRSLQSNFSVLRGPLMCNKARSDLTTLALSQQTACKSHGT